MRGGAALIGMHRNPWWLTPEGPTLDAGAFLVALEWATGRKARIVGKPAPAFFRVAIDRLAAEAAARGEPRLRRGDLAMVGDDVGSDIRGGRRAGLRTVFVRSGKHGDAELTAAASGPRLRAGRGRSVDRRGGRRARLSGGQFVGREMCTSSMPASTVESGPPSRASNRSRIVWPAQASMRATRSARRRPRWPPTGPFPDDRLGAASSTIARRWSADDAFAPCANSQRNPSAGRCPTGA